jgi:hypothetical protein
MSFISFNTQFWPEHKRDSNCSNNESNQGASTEINGVVLLLLGDDDCLGGKQGILLARCCALNASSCQHSVY